MRVSAGSQLHTKRPELVTLVVPLATTTLDINFYIRIPGHLYHCVNKGYAILPGAEHSLHKSHEISLLCCRPVI